MSSLMIEDPETFLRSYLLGDLTEAEADEVEHSLFADDALFELAQAMEGDLLAACARGDLAPEEQRKVLHRLAASPRGKHRLAVAEGLTALAHGATATQAMRKAVVVPFLRRPPLTQTPAFRFAAMAAVLCLVMAGGLRLAVLTARPGNATVARNQATEALRHAVPLQRPASSVPVQSHVAATPTPRTEERTIEEHKEIAPQPPHRAPATLVFQLALATLRSAGVERSVKTIPAGTELVEIHLPLSEEEPYTSYRATLLDDDSDAQVWQGKPASVAAIKGSMLVVSLPAAKLRPGRYRLELRGSAEGSEPELVGAPTFEVRTP